MTGRRGPVALLVGTQFAFNLGFYAVLPYLATHLTGELALSGWLVGLVLGLRTFSQQGLFVVGGALTDRFGPRPVVLAGCALRIAGFAWLGFAGGTWSVVGSVLLIGFAAALFSPAVETGVARLAVARERLTGVPRTRLLGVFHAAGQAGALIGPVLGAVLVGTGFRAACLAGAAVFAVILLGHLLLMPAGGPAPRGAGPGGAGAPVSFAGGLADVLRHRRFLALCAAYGGYLLLYNQMYLALPGEVRRATGDQAALGWLFALSSALVVVGQVPVSRWASRALSPRGAVLTGSALLAAGCAATAVLLPVRALGGLLPSVVFVVLLTAGQVLIVPAVRAWVPDLVDDGRLGLFTGALSSGAGLLVLVAGAPLGAVFDAGGPLPWLVLAGVAAASAACVPRHAPAPVR
ncbi:MFS transporter [Saccharothrix yanglingensis]|uniref:MFS transporter n=1 Tax=Saccharothrix yanglingensis TaxID=659496 RepID=A0ABU0WYQ6_9PSEU|nr:MFS transporter [Saccharothrix yanglingensis]MDQ2584995.1 MFS transporter [Saccharothrix yanglingensis]